MLKKILFPLTLGTVAAMGIGLVINPALASTINEENSLDSIEIANEEAEEAVDISLVGKIDEDVKDCYEAPVIEKASDIMVAIDGDTVGFKRLKGNAVALEKWYHFNRDLRNIVIPSTINHNGHTYTVTEVLPEAIGAIFYGDNEWAHVLSSLCGLESVTVPSTVTKIGDGAFAGRFIPYFNVKLPDSVEYIGDAAIEIECLIDDNNVLHLPKNLRHMGYHPMYVEREVMYVNIPEYLEDAEFIDDFGKFAFPGKIVVTSVAEGNKHLKLIDGALYSAKLDKIYLRTVHDRLYIPRTLRLDTKAIAKIMEVSYPFMLPYPEKIIVEEGNPWVEAKDNMLYDKKTKSLILPGKSSKGVVNVPEWCKDITAYNYIQEDLNFVFSNKAKGKDVASFTTQLSEFCGSHKCTITYLGTSGEIEADNAESLKKWIEAVCRNNPGNKEAKSLKKALL